MTECLFGLAGALGAFLLGSPTEGVFSPCLAIGTADGAYYVDSHQEDQLAFTADTRAIEVQS